MSSILITESIGVRKTKGPVRPTGNLTHVYLHGTSKTSTCTAQKSHEAKRCTTQDTINLGVLTQHGCWDFSTLCTNTYSMPGQINLPKSFNFTRNFVSNSHTKVQQIIFSRKFCEEKKLDFFPSFWLKQVLYLYKIKSSKILRHQLPPSSNKKN